MIRVENGATIEGGDGARHADLPGRLVDFDFGAGRHVAALFESPCNPDAAAGWRRLVPTEFLRGSFEHADEARVFQILQTEFERVDTGGMGEIIDVAFTSEVIGGRGQRAVGSLSQRRTGL